MRKAETSLFNPNQPIPDAYKVKMLIFKRACQNKADYRGINKH